MAKMAYGFSSGTDKETAARQAVDKAVEDGLLDKNKPFDIEIVETEEHIANNEFVIVIRTKEDE